MQPLSDLAFHDLVSTFEYRKSPLVGEHREALKVFLSVLEQGLTGDLPPKYHLLALDPGMGKTTALVSFIKAWRNADYKPAGSILVGISTKDDLRSFISETGLPSTDFGVLTADPDLNRMGLPESQHGAARVLFTTQAMIRARTMGRTFAQASAFHYDGTTRSLRLWDEAILPADSVVLRRDQLVTLAEHLRRDYPAFCEALDEFAETIRIGVAGSIIEVPTTLGLTQTRTRSGSMGLPDKLRSLFENLQLMLGSEMVLQSSQGYGAELIGTTPTLPDDFAPVIVTDASARVKTTYQLWADNRGNVVRLPEASANYLDLNIHLWKHSAGKVALGRQENLDKFAAAIVEAAIGRDPTGEWLIITYKDAQEGLEAAIKASIPSDAAPNFRWLTWGRHTSTNEFKDVDNVVLVGQRTYRPSDYLGLTLAASALPVTIKPLPPTRSTKEGEDMHHVLQALCRGSVRNVSNGMAKPCNAFLITTVNEGLLDLAFPGHSRSKWKDDEEAPGGQVARAIAFLEAEFADPAKTEVKKKALRDALGIKRAANLRQNVLLKDSFLQFLADNGLEDDEARAIRRVLCAFEEVI